MYDMALRSVLFSAPQVIPGWGSRHLQHYQASGIQFISHRDGGRGHNWCVDIQTTPEHKNDSRWKHHYGYPPIYCTPVETDPAGSWSPEDLEDAQDNI